MKHLLLLLLIVLAGCAGPKQFTPPDASALTAAHKELAGAVSAARAKVVSASRHVEEAAGHQREAVVSHSKEAVLEAEIAPRLADLRMRVTAELRPEVDALSGQMQALAGVAVETEKAIAETGTELGGARDDIGGAIATLITADRQAADINARLGPEYVVKVARTIMDANSVIVSTAAKVDREAKAKWIWFSAFSLTAVGFAAFAYFKR